jgi:hypothetical protein
MVVKLRIADGAVSILEPASERVLTGAIPGLPPRRGQPTLVRDDTRGRFELRVDARTTPPATAVEERFPAVPFAFYRFDFPLLGGADAGEAGALDAKMRANTQSTTAIYVPIPPSGHFRVTILDRTTRAQVLSFDETASRHDPTPEPRDRSAPPAAKH